MIHYSHRVYDRTMIPGNARRLRHAQALAGIAPLALLCAWLCACARPDFLPPPANQGPFPLMSQPGTYHHDDDIFPTVDKDTYQRMRMGDSIKVSMWGESVLSGEYLVGPSGNIVIPLLGDVQTSGCLVSEVGDKIRERIVKYYDKPILDVTVSKYAPRFAFVFGGVAKPGPVELSPGESILTAIGKAGGLTIRENERKQSLGVSRLARVIRGRNKMAILDLKALSDGTDFRANLAILPDDLIYIPRDETPVVSVLGQIRSPGLVGLTPGMDVTQAISLANGMTEDADHDDVRIIRKWWLPKPEVYNVDYDDLEYGKTAPPILLQDQDIVFIGERWVATFNYYLRQFTPTLSTYKAVPGQQGP